MAIRRWRGLSYISNLTPHLPAEAMEKTMMMMRRRRSRTMIAVKMIVIAQLRVFTSQTPSQTPACRGDGEVNDGEDLHMIPMWVAFMS